MLFRQESLALLLSPRSPRLALSWPRRQYNFQEKGIFLYSGQHRIDAIARDCYTEDIRGSCAV